MSPPPDKERPGQGDDPKSGPVSEHADGGKLDASLADTDDTWSEDRFAELTLELAYTVEELTKVARDPRFHQHRRAISTRNLSILHKVAAKLYVIRLDLRSRRSS